MAKPVIVSLDDDPEVLNAVVRDLRRRYGKDYRIVRATDGASAVEALRELKKRNEVVALYLVDQRMPDMSGVEFLREAITFYPKAKRALLTAYSDIEAAIQAINDVSVSHYLMKPWDPPEENLYPAIDDMLIDWQADYRPEFEGIRVIGHRWSPDSHEIKDFLARNQIPYQYLDIERNPEATELIEQLDLVGHDFPIIIFPDGVTLITPPLADVVEKVGLQTQAGRPFYDLIIVGGGPAGLAAAVYGASEGLSTLMIEREAPGGQAGTSSRIENYLGFPAGLSGADLARRATAQAKRFGVEILSPQTAVDFKIQDSYRIVTLADGSEVSCHALILALGLSYRTLEVPGVDQLTGAGIYYGASLTEATACKDDVVFIVGAGNSAGQAAVYLSNFASKVYILVRGNDLGAKMSNYLTERIVDIPNIEVRTQTEIASVAGDGHLEAVTIRDNADDTTETIRASGLFVFIGAKPQTDWLGEAVRRDGKGFILTGPQLHTEGRLPGDWNLNRTPFLLESSVPGVFVVGDVRSDSVKRVASAVGEGSIAVRFVHQYLSEGR